MKWAGVIAVIILIVLVVMNTDGKIKNVDVDAMMKRVRAAKKKKAIERSKVSYTPPAKHEGGIMKVA